MQKDSLQTFFQPRTWYLNFGPPGYGVVINFKGNHRQSQNPHSFSVLKRIRDGAHTDQYITMLKSFGERYAKPPVGYTRLCLKNEQVGKINEFNLAQLPGTLFRFRAIDTFHSGDRSMLEKKMNFVAPRVVSIKQGAHFIITRTLQYS